MNPDEFQPLVESFRRMLDEVALLHDLLLQESHALTARLVDQIQSVTEKKKDSVSRIQYQTNLQHGFFESKPLPAGQSGLDCFLAQFDEADPAILELRTYRKKIGEYLEKCQALNECNGSSIELMSRHIRRAIEILRNPGSQSETYGPDGNTHKTRVSRTRTSV